MRCGSRGPSPAHSPNRRARPENWRPRVPPARWRKNFDGFFIVVGHEQRASRQNNHSGNRGSSDPDDSTMPQRGLHRYQPEHSRKISLRSYNTRFEPTRPGWTAVGLSQSRPSDLQLFARFLRRRGRLMAPARGVPVQHCAFDPTFARLSIGSLRTVPVVRPMTRDPGQSVAARGRRGRYDKPLSRKRGCWRRGRGASSLSRR